ncbi:hypothetical protein ACFQ7F_31570 [Streptomyces sp. NPDC056486]|uniref:hypothetical protein n=1 Tax=Streptomyces sp. NPDC056486 TaxID=3345835 RepID=UPI0036B7E53D
MTSFPQEQRQRQWSVVRPGYGSSGSNPAARTSADARSSVAKLRAQNRQPFEPLLTLE